MVLDCVLVRFDLWFPFFCTWGKEVQGRKVRGGFRYGIIDAVAGRAGEVVTCGLLIELHTYMYRYSDGKS